MIGRAVYAVLALVAAASVSAADPMENIRNVGITGRLVAQVGSEHLGLRELGDEILVRLLRPGAEALARAQCAIEHAGLQGRFTVSVKDGKVAFHNHQALVCLEAADGHLLIPMVNGQVQCMAVTKN